MPKFQQKPNKEVIDAEQFHHPATSPRGVRTREDGSAYVVTIQGQEANLTAGDWVIDEGDGIHYYPCANEIFEKRWEVANYSDHLNQSQCLRLREALRAIADPEHCLTAHGEKGLRDLAKAALDEIDPANDYSSCTGPGKPEVSGNDIADQIEAQIPDWRIGLSAKPKYRQHEMYYEPPARIVAVHPSGFGGIFCKDGVLVLEGRFGTRFLAAAEEWKTA